MDNEIDASNGGESLTLDQAAAAYAKATAEPVSDDHGAEEADESVAEDLEPSEDIEDDGQTESEEHPDETADDEPESDQGRFVADNAKVRLSDGTVTTVHELKRGFLREGDYTRKTQETSTRLKGIEEREAQHKASQEHLAIQLKYAEDLITSIVGTGPDPSLADPNSPNFDLVKYLQQEASHKEWSKHLDYIKGERTKADTERTQKAQTDEVAKANDEWNALVQTKGYEHLKDPARANAFAKNVSEYAAKYGFTSQEDRKAIALNHNFAVILDKAARYDKLQTDKATVARKVENRPPVTRGGRRASPQEQRARSVNDAMKNLQQTGRLDDAVAAYLATQQS